jgi:protein-tyrosine phosphatase
MRILMVCLGNICRSPMAEGILKSKVQQRGLDWEVDSAGTGSWHIGERPDPRSIAEAGRNGIDITAQRARQFSSADFDAFDLILAMDQANYQDILRLAGNGAHKEKVAMIMNFAQPGKGLSVPDPYWDDDGFNQVFTMLEEACERIIEEYL